MEKDIEKNTDENTNENEFVLYQDEEKDEERIDHSGSEIEMISDEEYMLECARFGDLDDLKALFEENKNIDVNYKDNRSHTALRM
jgi:hypothetical protein